MESNGVKEVTSFSELMQIVRKCDWYWGNMSWQEAEKILLKEQPGTYLVRDSASDLHIFSISYRTNHGVHHTRLSHHNGNICLGGPNSLIKAESLVSFVEKSMYTCFNRDICMLMHRKGDHFPVEVLQLNRLLRRQAVLPPLQYLCRLFIRHNVDYNLLSTLPLSPKVLRYLQDPKYIVPPYS